MNVTNVLQSWLFRCVYIFLGKQIENDMLANVEMRYSNNFEIDLEDYGHSIYTTFEELSEDEKSEILDHLREEAVIGVSIKTITD